MAKTSYIFEGSPILNSKSWLLISILFSLFQTSLFADQYLDLNEADTWRMKHLIKTTDFNVIISSGEPVLTLKSKHSASLYFRLIDIDLKKTPFLNWSWKISHVFHNQSEKIRSGDDFPARVLIVYEEGLIGSKTIGFSFVWASSSEKGAIWQSHVSRNLLMVASQSGKAHVNQWLTEKVDLRTTFKDLLKRDVKRVNYIALMADTDDLKEMVTTQFKSIYFSSH
jgi:hypothetical protein